MTKLLILSDSHGSTQAVPPRPAGGAKYTPSRRRAVVGGASAVYPGMGAFQVKR